MTEFFSDRHFVAQADRSAFRATGDKVDVIISGGFKETIFGTIATNESEFSPGEIALIGDEVTFTALKADVHWEILAVDAGEGFLTVGKPINNRDGTLTYRLSDCPYTPSSCSRSARASSKKKTLKRSQRRCHASD